ILVRRWTAFQKLGVSNITAPGMYHTGTSLDPGTTIGGYRGVTTPEEPIIVRMVRNPNKPGLPRREQHRAGQQELLSMTFEQFELEIRRQLARMLAGGGFDTAGSRRTARRCRRRRCSWRARILQIDRSTRSLGNTHGVTARIVQVRAYNPLVSSSGRGFPTRTTVRSPCASVESRAGNFSKEPEPRWPPWASSRRGRQSPRSEPARPRAAPPARQSA